MSAGALWSGWEPQPAPPPPPPPPAPRAAAPARRRPAPPRPRIVDFLTALAGLGVCITVTLAVAAESAGTLQAAGGVATALGRVTGLVATYAMVVVVVLVARFPPLERAVGQDRLVRWYRTLGPWPLYLLCAHGALITIGYTQAADAGLLHQLGRLLWTYPGVLAATAGFALLIAAGVTSYRLARRRLAYETWWSRERVRLDAARLEALAPGLAGRDVYVRGPDGFAAAVTAAVREAGVPADRIHHESFAL